MLGILEKISPSEIVSNGYTYMYMYNVHVVQNIIKCDAHAQNSKSLFIYISAVSESILLKRQIYTKNHFW